MTITFESYSADLRERLLAHDPARLVAMHVDIDPVDKLAELSIFTDDGHGNGVCIFAAALDSVVASAAGVAMRRGLVDELAAPCATAPPEPQPEKDNGRRVTFASDDTGATYRVIWDVGHGHPGPIVVIRVGLHGDDQGRPLSLKSAKAKALIAQARAQL